MNISVSITNFESVNDLMDAYPQRVVNASKRSVNKAAKGLKTEAGKAISAKYAIKQKDIKTAITRTIAKAREAFAEVKIKGEYMPLDKFSHRPSGLGVRRPKDGIKVQIRRGAATLYKGSFIAPTAGGIKIFIRSDKSSLPSNRKLTEKEKKRPSAYPIERLYGPAVSQMLDNKDIGALRLSAKERFFKAFEHEMTQGFKHGGRRGK